jgi:aminoglycoside phosphotransferase (APT) family kinase protein
VTPPDLDGLEADLAAWVMHAVGSRITGVRRLGRWRPTWFVDVEDSIAGSHLLLKTPRAPQHIIDRSAMLRRFGVDREAAVIRALQGSPVPVAPFVAHDPARHLLLLGVVRGSGVVTALPNVVDRERVMTGYGRALAATHALDPAALDLGDVFDDDAAERSCYPGALAAVVHDWNYVRTTLPAPEPLFDLALLWLREHEPAPADVRLLHGDAGANQFMHEQGQVTALLDWELSYLGDPISDLGYARYREALYPSGCYQPFAKAYADASGRTLDRARLDWCTVAAALVMLIGIARDVHRPRARNAESVQRLWWDALTRAAVCQVLGESLGLPARAPTEVAPRSQTAVSSVAELLVEQLDEQVAEAPDDESARRRRGSLALARSLQRAVSVDHHELVDGVRGEQLSASIAATGLRAMEGVLAELTSDASARLAIALPMAVTDIWDDDPRVTPDWSARLHAPVLPAVEPIGDVAAAP